MISGRILMLCFGLTTAAVLAQTSHTPGAGSAERKAICDGARAYVLSKYAERALPQPIVFKVERMMVSGPYANMEGVPIFKDGTPAIPNYLPDIVLNFCLQKGGAGWQVVADLSRTDVPSAAEAAAIRRRLPEDFPVTLLSSDWQNLLGQ